MLLHSKLDRVESWRIRVDYLRRYLSENISITWSNTFSGLLSRLSWCDELDALLISIRGVVGVCNIFVVFADDDGFAAQTVVVDVVVRVVVLIIDVTVVVVNEIGTFVFRGLGFCFDVVCTVVVLALVADGGCSFISGRRDKSGGLLDDESI